MTSVPLQTWGENIPVNTNGSLAIIFFVIFLVVMIVIGILAGRRQRNQEDYFAAGRSGGIIAIALAAFAAIQSGWGIVGNPGSIYGAGFEFFAVSMTLPFGFVFAYWLLARKMRMLGEVKNAITAPDAMYHRFPDERIRLLGAISVFAGSIGYLAAQYAALGIIGAIILPLTFIQALIIGLAVVAFYSTVGGILAGIWSDAIQGTMMIIGGILTSFYLFTRFPGGLAGMTQTIQANAPRFFNFSIFGQNALIAIGLPISLLMITLTIAGQPHFVTKFYMTRKVSILKWGAIISGGGYLATTLYWWTAPFLQAAVFNGQVNGPVTNPDVTLPLALIRYAPSAVTAFVLTSVIAAIMSTSNSFLNIGSAAIIHDYLIEYRGTTLSDSQQVTYSRITTLIILIISFVLAASFPGLIFVLGSAGWAIFGTVIFPSIAIAYNWKGATTEGVLWGSGFGLIATLFLAYGPQYLGINVPLDFTGGQLAQILGLIVFFGVSLITSTAEYDDLDDEVQAIMDIGRLRGGENPTGGVAADGGEPNDD